MRQKTIKNIIEAALMVSTQPLSIKRLMNLFEEDKSLQPNRDNVKKAICDLQKDYEGRGVILVEVASGCRFQADDEYAGWVNHLFDFIYEDKTIAIMSNPLLCWSTAIFNTWVDEARES